MSDSGKFERVKPRPTVEINLADDEVLRGPRGAQVGEFLQTLNGGPPLEGVYLNGSPVSPPIVGAVVNGQLRELTYPIEIESQVKPVSMSEPDGMRIYRRSLTFLLETAFESIILSPPVAITAMS